MSQPATRDVYFWSRKTGLLEFPGVLFAVNVTAARNDLISPHAEPVARWTATGEPGTEPVPPVGVGAYGLLWSPEPGGGRGIPHVIPVVVTQWTAASRGNRTADTHWDVTVRWRSFGPFVAGGVPVDGAGEALAAT